MLYNKNPENSMSIKINSKSLVNVSNKTNKNNLNRKKKSKMKYWAWSKNSKTMLSTFNKC